MTDLFSVTPALTLVVWLVHAWWSWSRPQRFDPSGILLFGGIVVALIATVVAFGMAPVRDMDDPSPWPPGQHDERMTLIFLFAELVAIGFVALVLEVVLIPLRAVRRSRIIRSEAEQGT